MCIDHGACLRDSDSTLEKVQIQWRSHGRRPPIDDPCQPARRTRSLTRPGQVQNTHYGGFYQSTNSLLKAR